MIHRHGKCLGIVLFQGFKRHVELWFCPKGYKIQPHFHAFQDNELTFIWGKTMFCKLNYLNKVESIFVDRRLMFKTFKIPAGTPHWFEVSNNILIFINSAKMLYGYPPTSAAEDFHNLDLKNYVK